MVKQQDIPLFDRKAVVASTLVSPACAALLGTQLPKTCCARCTGRHPVDCTLPCGAKYWLPKLFHGPQPCLRPRNTAAHPSPCPPSHLPLWQEMTIPRYLEAESVPGILAPTAYGFTVHSTKPGAKASVRACALLPRYSTSLFKYVWKFNKLRKPIPQATVALVTRALLGATAGLERHRVVHK